VSRPNPAAPRPLTYAQIRPSTGLIAMNVASRRACAANEIGRASAPGAVRPNVPGLACCRPRGGVTRARPEHQITVPSMSRARVDCPSPYALAGVSASNPDSSGCQKTGTQRSPWPCATTSQLRWITPNRVRTRDSRTVVGRCRAAARRRPTRTALAITTANSSRPTYTTPPVRLSALAKVVSRGA